LLDFVPLLGILLGLTKIMNVNCNECNDTGKIKIKGILTGKNKMRKEFHCTHPCSFCETGLNWKQEITSFIKDDNHDRQQKS
jgi:hypothetical protein